MILWNYCHPSTMFLGPRVQALVQGKRERLQREESTSQSCCWEDCRCRFPSCLQKFYVFYVISALLNLPWLTLPHYCVQYIYVGDVVIILFVILKAIFLPCSHGCIPLIRVNRPLVTCLQPCGPWCHPVPMVSIPLQSPPVSILFLFFYSEVINSSFCTEYLLAVPPNSCSQAKTKQLILTISLHNYSSC